MIVTDIETAFVERSLRNAGLPFSKGQPKMETLKKLANSKQRSHAKFLRQMKIACNISASGYWWKEADTTKIEAIRMSTSTMHTLLKTQLTLDNFEIASNIGKEIKQMVMRSLLNTISDIDQIRMIGNDETETLMSIKTILPESFIYHSHYTMNYENLRTMYHDRKNHRVPEWQTFLDSFKDIPYFKEFIAGDTK